MHWDNRQIMLDKNNKRRPILLALLVSGHANAAPIEGDIASNAAAILVVLGFWALLMGVRNLRELRHKRHAPERQRRNDSNSPQSLVD